MWSGYDSYKIINSAQLTISNPSIRYDRQILCKDNTCYNSLKFVGNNTNSQICIRSEICFSGKTTVNVPKIINFDGT